MEKYHKCFVENGILNPCPTLEKAFEETNSNKKGVSLFVLTNIDTGTVSRTTATLRSGDLPRNGVIINYCPFCGESIADHMK